jgi:hypothetical protein
MSLRLLVYDGTNKEGESFLRTSWATGARLYRAMGRVNAYHDAHSWADALSWLSTFRSGEQIAEVQFWGHGKWGHALIADDAFSVTSLAPSHAHEKLITALSERLLPNGESLVWFRTCETVGARAGHDFAMRLSDGLGARVAGHTHVIAAFQSGLHGLRPGERPRWSADEGLERGTAEAPLSAKWSSPSAPNTIHFLNNEVPPAWFDG